MIKHRTHVWLVECWCSFGVPVEGWDPHICTRAYTTRKDAVAGLCRIRENDPKKRYRVTRYNRNGAS